MAQASPPPLLLQICNGTAAERIAALRALKNELVGHGERKATWVRYGGLGAIVAALGGSALRGAPLASPVRMNGNGLAGTDPAGTAALSSVKELSDEEIVRLQALQLVAAFANGGAPFLPPLYAAGALPAVLAHISPLSNHPSLVRAALRALADIVRAAMFAPPRCSLDAALLADTLFSPPYSSYLQQILARWTKDTSRGGVERINIVAGIIASLCTEERHQLALCDEGVLDQLAAMVAGFAVAEGQVPPGGPRHADSLAAAVPPAAPAGLSFGKVVDAVGAVIADSSYRACKFLWSAPISCTFVVAPYFSPSEAVKSAWKALEDHGLFAGPAPRGAMDYLLPPVTNPRVRLRPADTGIGTCRPGASDELKEFDRTPASRPASWQSAGRPSASHSDSIANHTGDPDADEPNNPVLPWLVHQIRSRRSDHDRLAAAGLLCPLLNLHFAREYRESGVGGLLVIPLIRDMLAASDVTAAMAASSGPASPDEPRSWLVLERAPAVLARLVTDNTAMQKAACESKAIKELSVLLKATFDAPYSTARPAAWSPDGDAPPEMPELPEPCSMGREGPAPILVHLARVRAGVLKAICALCAGTEGYRKEFGSEEIVPYVVEALSQYPGKPSRAAKSKMTLESADEPIPAHAGREASPVSVIVAACHVVRTISRSVGILRTSLVDSGAAVPLFRNLRHPDPDVQVAAAAAVCNLVIKVSPMRQSLIDFGVFPVLCDHARSENPALRLNAIWALKHLVDEIDHGFKKRCMDRLDLPWLVHLLSGETDGNAAPPVRRRTLTPGQQPAGGPDEDVDMDRYEKISPSALCRPPPRGNAGFGLHNGSGRPVNRRLSARLVRLENMRAAEAEYPHRDQGYAAAVQEQCLDVLRNVLVRSDPEPRPEQAAEIVEIVLGSVGHERFFEILLAKIQPWPSFFGPPGNPPPGTPVVHVPPPRIVSSVLYLLANIAASVPRHKQLLMVQSRLLELVAAFAAACPDPVVRAGLGHLVSNLTSDDDPGDEQGRLWRVKELRRLGFADKLGRMGDDECNDVKQRAGQAYFHLTGTELLLGRSERRRIGSGLGSAGYHGTT